jgi:hypothetical protein
VRIVAGVGFSVGSAGSRRRFSTIGRRGSSPRRRRPFVPAQLASSSVDWLARLGCILPAPFDWRSDTVNARPNDVPFDAESDGHISICCALSSAPRLAPEHGTLSRHPSFCTHRLFRAMSHSSPGRLPSARSSAFHRGGTRAIPFYRSHAFASRPLSPESSCYPPVTESEPPSRAIPPSSTAVAASERRKGHASLISTNPPRLPSTPLDRRILEHGQRAFQRRLPHVLPTRMRSDPAVLESQRA